MDVWISDEVAGQIIQAKYNLDKMKEAPLPQKIQVHISSLEEYGVELQSWCYAAASTQRGREQSLLLLRFHLLPDKEVNLAWIKLICK